MRVGKLVVATLAVVAVVVLVFRQERVDTAEDIFRTPAAVTAYRLDRLRQWATDYRSRTGRAPPSLRLLAGDAESAALLTDGWGTLIRYEVLVSGELVLRAAGPDRTFSTADDLSVSTADGLRVP